MCAIFTESSDECLTSVQFHVNLWLRSKKKVYNGDRNHLKAPVNLYLQLLCGCFTCKYESYSKDEPLHQGGKKKITSGWGTFSQVFRKACLIKAIVVNLTTLEWVTNGSHEQRNTHCGDERFPTSHRINMSNSRTSKHTFNCVFWATVLAGCRKSFKARRNETGIF